MCLVILNWQPGCPTSLIIAANRDEFYARPALALHRWPEQRILAGQDVQAGGTWFGIGWGSALSVHGIRVAVLTNYRDTKRNNANAPSRGQITTAFLGGSMSATAYLRELAQAASMYNPFNLIVFDGRNLMGFESRRLRQFVMPPGLTAVSNADFNTPWPKLLRLQKGVQHALAGQSATLEPRLFNLLADNHVASDEDLPQTGVPMDWERTLSAPFIRTPDYGTRASSVLRVGAKAATFTERSFDADGFKGEVCQHLQWDDLSTE